MADGTEREYILSGTYKGMDQYECPYCGYCGKALEVPEGTPCPECPVCRNPPHLLPCPVCGKIPNIEWEPDDNYDVCVFIECVECAYRTGLYEDLDRAVAVWNDRIPPETSGPYIGGIEPPKEEIRYEGRLSYNLQCAEYKCGCGWYFILHPGERIKCPTCEEIRELTPTLKPCPFCGGRPTIDMRPDAELDYSYGNSRYGFVVQCTNCRIETIRVDTPEEAAESWNHRPAEPKPQAPPNAWFRGQGKPTEALGNLRGS